MFSVLASKELNNRSFVHCLETYDRGRGTLCMKKLTCLSRLSCEEIIINNENALLLREWKFWCYFKDKHLCLEHTLNGILKYNLTHSLKLSLMFIYLLRFTLFLFCFNYFIYTWGNRFTYVWKSSYFGEAYENALFSNKKIFQSLFYTAICHPWPRFYIRF